MKKPKLLFLCTGNSARSQMAEAFTRKYAGARFDVYSAGLEPKGIHPCTVKVMEEIGFDMSGHSSKDLQQYLGKIQFDTVITVCANAEERCPTVPGVGTRLHWPFDDPTAFKGTDDELLARFREVRDQISAKIRLWLDNSNGL